MRTTYTEWAPEPIGPYSQGVISGNMFYVWGQIGINPETHLLKEWWITGQTHQVFSNLNAVLESANLTFQNVVKVNVYLADIRDYEAVNIIYKDYITHKPARSCIAVSALRSNALVTIEVVAEIA